MTLVPGKREGHAAYLPDGVTIGIVFNLWCRDDHGSSSQLHNEELGSEV